MRCCVADGPGGRRRPWPRPPVGTARVPPHCILIPSSFCTPRHRTFRVPGPAMNGDASCSPLRSPLSSTRLRAVFIYPSPAFHPMASGAMWLLCWSPDPPPIPPPLPSLCAAAMRLPNSQRLPHPTPRPHFPYQKALALFPFCASPLFGGSQMISTSVGPHRGHPPHHRVPCGFPPLFPLSRWFPGPGSLYITPERARTWRPATPLPPVFPYSLNIFRAAPSPFSNVSMSPSLDESGETPAAVPARLSNGHGTKPVAHPCKSAPTPK